MMEAVVLGSSGWLPRVGRGTTSVCLRAGSTLFVFDAGSGLSRLADPLLARLITGEFEVSLFLSHLHLDHTVGLSYLPALLPGRRTTVFAPDVDRPGDGPDWLRKLISPPFFPHSFEEFSLPVDLRRAEPGEMEIGGRRVAIRRQVHPGGSLGYRIDDAFAFLTDYAPDPELSGFAAGVRLLIHEAWNARPADGRQPPPHHAAIEAALVARDAAVGELILSHLNPMLSDNQMEQVLLAARTVFPNAHLAEDGLSRLIS